jgi:hypothetical protein
MSPPYPIGLPSRNHDQRAVRFCSTRINLRCIDFATRRQDRSEAPGHGRSIGNLSPGTGRRPEAPRSKIVTSDNWSSREWRLGLSDFAFHYAARKPRPASLPAALAAAAEDAKINRKVACTPSDEMEVGPLQK